uniref:Uncharacterized protein n=2 Tax=Clytia hemisphaerica TaxID=252671 RepID=A0A7M5V4H6_9CNID
VGITDSENQRRTFEVFKLYLNREKDLYTGNSYIRKCLLYDNQHQCVDAEFVKDLELLTRLEIWGWNWLGDEYNPFLHLFPNLRVLFVRPVRHVDADEISITLTDFPLLRRLKIDLHQSGKVHMYCAFGSNQCLTHSEGLKEMEIRFPPNGDVKYPFKLIGKWSLPKQIHDLRLLSVSLVDHYNEEAKTTSNGDGFGFKRQNMRHVTPAIKVQQTKAAKKNTQANNGREIHPIFDRTEFGNVEISLFSMSMAGLTLGDFKLPYVKGKFKISADDDITEAVGKQLIKMEVEYVADIPTPLYPIMIYFVYMQKNFEKFQFMSCHYANTLLKNMKVETILSLKKMIVRGFHMKLSEVIKLAKGDVNYKRVNEIRVFVYSLDVDTSYNDRKLIDDKTYEFFYVEVGMTNIAFGNGHYIKSKYPENKRKFAPFFHVGNVRVPDPIFLRALTTCFIVKITEASDRSPKQLMAEDEKLDRWFTVIERMHRSASKHGEELHQQFSDLEISRTKHSFSYLQWYLQWRENAFSEVAQLPLLSLQVHSENMQILGDAGRDLLRRKEHLKTVSSVNEITSLVQSSLTETRDAIADSKIAILQAAKAKSTSLANIEQRRLEELQEEIDKSGELIKHLSEKFKSFKTEVEKETETFQAGVKLAMGLAIAEAAVEGFNMVMGVFSGNFNPMGALRALKAATQLKSVLSKIITIFRKLAALMKRGKQIGGMFKMTQSAYKGKYARV